MADEKTEEKTKRTVPQLVRSAIGIAEHAEAVLEMQWDKERKVFRDPFTVMLSLFTYAKLTARLLHESEERAKKEITRLENRLAEFETRLTTMEGWRNDVQAQSAEMIKGIEELAKNDPEAFNKGLLSIAPQPTLPPKKTDTDEKPNGETAPVKGGVA